MFTSANAEEGTGSLTITKDFEFFRQYGDFWSEETDYNSNQNNYLPSATPAPPAYPETVTVNVTGPEGASSTTRPVTLERNKGWEVTLEGLPAGVYTVSEVTGESNAAVELDTNQNPFGFHFNRYLIQVNGSIRSDHKVTVPQSQSASVTIKNIYVPTIKTARVRFMKVLGEDSVPLESLPGIDSNGRMKDYFAYTSVGPIGMPWLETKTSLLHNESLPQGNLGEISYGEYDINEYTDDTVANKQFVDADREGYLRETTITTYYNQNGTLIEDISETAYNENESPTIYLNVDDSTKLTDEQKTTVRATANALISAYHPRYEDSDAIGSNIGDIVVIISNTYSKGRLTLKMANSGLPDALLATRAATFTVTSDNGYSKTVTLNKDNNWQVILPLTNAGEYQITEVDIGGDVNGYTRSATYAQGAKTGDDALKMTVTETGLEEFTVTMNNAFTSNATPTVAPTDRPITEVPETGDDRPLGLWLALIVLSAADIMLVLKRRRAQR